MGRLGIDDLESMKGAVLDKTGQSELLAAQTECSFVFLREDGWPGAVVMNYLMDDGVFWLTAVEARLHVRAIADDARVSIVVSSAGTQLKGRRMVAIRGLAEVHRDPVVVGRWLTRFSSSLRPQDPEAMRELLDSPNRVILEVRPVAVSASHDHRKIKRVRTRDPGR